MKIARALLFAAALVATATATGIQTTCQDGTPEPTTPTPSTPAPTTPEPTTPTPTTPAPTTPAPTTPAPTTPAPTTPAPTTPAPTTPALTTPAPTTPAPTTPAPTTPAPTTPAPTTPAPTTPAPTTPPPPTCSLGTTDIAFVGDRDSEIPISSRDLASCCATCASTRGCHAFVHYDVGNKCSLLTSNVTRKIEASGAVSGFVDSPKQCLFEPVGTKLVGTVYDQYLFQSADDCCGFCGHEKQCVAYNFDPSREICELLKSVSDKTTSAGWISGKNQ